MPLIIHATVEVFGDAAAVGALRVRLNERLAAFPGTSFTETHSANSLHYDLKTGEGLPFPALIAASEAFPDLTLHVRWVNPRMEVSGSAEIRAGRVAAQSQEVSGGEALARQRQYVAIAADGSLHLAYTIIVERSDGCAGYAVSAERDALFDFICRGDRRVVYLAEEDSGAWDGCWEFDPNGHATECDPLQAAAIDPAAYRRWREHAERFLAEWCWLERDDASATVLERQHFANHCVPTHAANLHYAKIKSLRERPIASGQLHVLDSTGGDFPELCHLLTACLVET